MRTPAKYNTLIKNGKITSQILGEVLYSINKRAKNWRDKKKEYKSLRYDRYDNYEKALEQEQNYYRMKENILKKLEPIAIHKEIIVSEYIRKVYDYENEYYSINDSEVIDENGYFDRETGDYISFKKVREKSEKELYYLFYEVSEYSFHQPINKSDIDKYNLEIIELDGLITYGKDINDLLSTQFCQKVYELFINDKLEIIEG